MKLWKGLLPALLLLALVAVMPAAAAPPAAPSPPSTLTGETLTAIGSGGGSVNCLNTGSFSFSVSGTATGPYTGTFTETVMGTVNPALTLATFSASFTIHSATGDVTGTKTLSGPSFLSICYQDSNDVFATEFPIQTTYQATIHTSQGNYTDHGSADTVFSRSSGTVTYFNEFFFSSQTQTTLIVPTSADQCKDGGYQNFGGLFKNQGDCVSFVATGGKNPPSGP